MTTRAATGSLELTFVVHASRSTVYRFFTDPARFARWWACPGGGRATIEPRVGGAVRIEYQRSPAVMSGKVVEMVPDLRFVFTWGYEPGNDGVPAGSSRVEFSLADHAEGTLLTLRHTGLAPDQAIGHEFGWRHYGSVVAGECAKDQIGARVERLTAGWFEAWRPIDDAARRALLAEITEEDVELRDTFACIRGREQLAAHIANGLRHMPGVKLEPTGPVQQQHGYVRVAWRMSGAPGMPEVRGENVYRVSVEGKIAGVVGFWG